MLCLLASTASAGDYVIGPKDALRIEVYDNPDLTGNVVVASDGTIPFPHLISVDVAGLSTAETAERIRVELEADYLVNPHVTVSVTGYRSQPVDVIGAVKEPGVRYLTGDTMLKEFLTTYGWVDSEKSIGEIHIQRGAQTIKVMVAELAANRSNQPVLAGDTIVVPASQYVYVDGEVENPGAVRYQDGLTVLQALTHAGGPSTLAKLRKAIVLRNGEPIPVNIKKVQAGREADLALHPGDQLLLKESPI